MTHIIRIYPKHKELLFYPTRLQNKDFDNYKNLLNNDKLLSAKYEKWKNGINYTTNRKININGKIHNDLKSIFIIKCEGKYILFDKFINIDFKKYLTETKNIYDDIKHKNKETTEYNDNIDKIIMDINNLEKWDDFIEFESIKYGLPKIVNNIHKENNCSGEILDDIHEICCCNRCENWTGCGRNGTQHYKCNNCSYSTKSINYKDK